MKRIHTLLLLVLVASLTACLSDECTETHTFYQYTPVMVNLNEFRTPTINTFANKTLIHPGKIYFYKNYLLINEQGKGIHFYDISQEATPKYVVFYDILGNFDMAIQNDRLFVDNVIDLVQIDISNISQPRIVNRVNDFNNTYQNSGQKEFVAYYEKSNISQVFDCSIANNNRFFRNNGGWWGNNQDVISVAAINKQNSGNTGIGGSTARFTLAHDHLYTVDNSNLSTWNIKNLERLSTKQMGWGIETIFPFKDKLFVGSNTGMFIYDAQDPANPKLRSTFTHARACDPVVANDTRAYVTLRTGNACAGTNNQMDIINIQNIDNPQLVKTVAMKNPHGLAILGNKAYVCEGKYGLKVVNIDRDNGETISENRSIESTDVIALRENNLLVVGPKGFYFVDASDAKNLKVKGSILKSDK